jgi:molybdate transport system substrate-binding protein
MFRGAILALAVVSGLGAAAPPLTVSAAVSLSEALTEIADAYARSGGGPVRYNFAGSNVLARQILNGAPVDVFVSADEQQMDVVVSAAAIVPGSQVPIAGNQLAVVALKERAGEIREAFAPAAPVIRRLAIGDPAAVPAGVYAREYLQAQGLWKKFERRIVPTANVRAALSVVENGNADAAIVYASDVRAARNTTIALLVPVEEGPAIAYYAAVVARSTRRDEAQRFVRFLGSDAAQAIFVRRGFLKAPAPAQPQH